MSDKKTIGLTPAGEAVMERLMEKGCFKDKMDAAKFAMSVAIRAQVAPDHPIEGANTIWNVGSFDADGQLRQLIPILYPDYKEPYRTAECLIDRGLARLKTQIDDGVFDTVSTLRNV